MSVLTDLYSDPELAVIREYSTNALDAHKVAGESRPIEVTTPSPLAPFFRVRDYGEGLDARDIREVFSRYGTSTKRESNDVVGMLGLGCKSALTYADQFTLIATKDGRTVQVLVSRDEDGAGSMVIVSDDATDAPSGVEVVVPCERANTFAEKSASFFAHWSAGSVLIDGEPPTPLEGLQLAPNLLLTQGVDRDLIVMGNVPYPMLEDDAARANVPWRRSYAARYFLVAYVDIGEVMFTPSREALQATKGTRETLAKVRADALAAFDASMRALVEAADSPAEAVRVLREAQAMGYKGAATYRGKDVPTALDRSPRRVDGERVYADAADSPATSFLIRSGRTRRVNGERDWSIPIDGAPRVYFDGFDSRELTPTKREKIAAYFDAKGDADSATLPQVFAVRYSREDRYWLGDAAIVPWSDVDAIKLDRPKAADGTTRPRGQYDALVRGALVQVPADEIDTSRPLYFANVNKWGVSHVDEVRRGIIETAGCTIVALPAGRVAKFRRDFPTAVEVGEAARSIASAWLRAQTADALDAYRFQRNGVGPLKDADPARLDDPALAAAAKAARRDTSKIAEGANRFGFVLPHSTFHGESAHGNALAGYPLASNVYGDLARDHFYVYCNTVYAITLAGENGSPADAATTRQKG